MEFFIHERCIHCNAFSFSQELVIFGVKERTDTDRVLDFIILLAKVFIYNCKVENQLPRIRVFINFLKYRHSFEKYVATIQGKRIDFEFSWQLYLPLFSETDLPLSLMS